MIDNDYLYENRAADEEILINLNSDVFLSRDSVELLLFL